MRGNLSGFYHFESIMTGNHQVLGVMPGVLKAPKVLVQVLESDIAGELTGCDRIWEVVIGNRQDMTGCDRK